MEEGAVAPIRFGAVFSDVDLVRAEVGGRADELRAALAHVDDHVELGVRVVRPQPAEQRDPSTGSEYLRRRLDERRAGLADAALVDGRLAALAADRRARSLETAELVLSASYLVRRGDVECFRLEVEALLRERPDLRIMCTGPWPPYSFVEEER